MATPKKVKEVAVEAPERTIKDGYVKVKNFYNQTIFVSKERLKRLKKREQTVEFNPEFEEKK